MNITKIICFIGIVVAWLVKPCYSQDIQFSQFYAASTYMNPAFAGSVHQTRGMLHQRLQWPRLDAKYLTSFASVDTYFDTYKSGFGLTALHDIQGGNTIASTEIAVQYAYEMHLGSNLTFRPGLQLGYASRTLDYSHLYFSPQINDRGVMLGGNAGNPRTQYVDFSSGGILYSDHFWVGIAAHHMNRPNQSFIGEISKLPPKYSFVGGYKIMIKKSAYSNSQDRSEVAIIPTFQYKLQGKSDQFDVGAYGIYDQLIVGVWYRGLPWVKRYLPKLHNNESMILLVGWKFDNINITYSYDFVVSRLAPARTGGAHEINITYIYSRKKNYKPRRVLPCPKFKG